MILPRLLMLFSIFIPLVQNATYYKTFFVEPGTDPARLQKICDEQYPCIEADIDPKFEYQAHNGFHIYMVIMYVPDWEAAIFFPWSWCLEYGEGNPMYCVQYNDDRTSFTAWRADFTAPYDVLFVDER